MSTASIFNNYTVPPKTWDEMYAGEDVRTPYQSVHDFLRQFSQDELSKKEEMARRLFMSQGITFTVYSSGEGIEKIFPFDVIPRIVTASEWDFIERGITQRLKALNLFLKDVYHDQFIIKDGIVPIDLIYSCPHYLREMQGVNVPHDVYVHIAGIDLIRDYDGTYYILEDKFSLIIFFQEFIFLEFVKIKLHFVSNLKFFLCNFFTLLSNSLDDFKYSIHINVKILFFTSLL
jgi:uncharacterized circularly permuted ATP-grasp superfamily protein